MVNHKKRRKRFRILILLLWILALAMSLEILLRLYRVHVKYNNPFVLQARRRYSKFMEATAPSLWAKGGAHYKYLKNSELKFEADGSLYHIKISSEGFRTREVAIPKPSDKFRIVIVGGSTTVEGSTNEQTFPALLETKLNADLKTNHVEVVNCGVSGIRTVMMSHRIKDYLKFEPDLLVVFAGFNDFNFFYLPEWEKRHTVLQQALKLSEIARTVLYRQLLPNEQQMQYWFSSTTIKNFLKMRQAARLKGCKFMLCTFAYPEPTQLSREEYQYLTYDLRETWNRDYMTYNGYCAYMEVYNRYLTRIGQELKIRILPVANNIRGGMDLFRDACHMTPKGIEIKADTFFGYLKDYVRGPR